MPYGDFLATIATPRNLLGFGFAGGFMVAAGLAVRSLGTISPLALRNAAVSLMFFLTSWLLAPLAGLAIRGATARYADLGLPGLTPAFWAAQPVWAVVLVALVARDGVSYTIHRLLHGRFGWPVHAIHHSDSHVNGFTAWRVHPIEPLATNLLAVVMMGWLGLPTGLGAIVLLIALLYEIYIHLEVDIEHGPLRHVLASPRFHRWHHYDSEPAYNSNYANMFPLYDVIFGTYRRPHVLPVPIGAASAGVPDLDYIRLMTFPFLEWGTMASRWWRARATPAV
jgi:sterol desaturase/sphingolipid hydroxylase (fatty acid hydroxylase superfamily)